MRLILGGAALVSAVCYGGWLRAEADTRCAAVRAMAGAQERVQADLIVIAPTPDGGWRLCFWNSPNSQGGAFEFDFDGVIVSARVQVDGMGPETLHVNAPGAIVTDLDGYPLREISAPDSDEMQALLLPWVG
jgi:hypothetical protein